MLRRIPSLWALPSRTSRCQHRNFRNSAACATANLSASDKVWIADQDIDPTRGRGYARDFGLRWEKVKPPSVKMLPQIARQVVNANPDASMEHVVRRVVERAGFGWGRCWECGKTSITPKVNDSSSTTHNQEQQETPPLLVLPLPFPHAGPSSGKLPHNIITGTCRDLSDLTFQHGPLAHQKSLEVRSQYIATLWKRIIPLFRGTLTSTIERRLDDGGDDDRQGEAISHRFDLFGSTTVVFLHTDVPISAVPLQQVIAEAETSDYANATNGLWSPVIAILGNGTSFQFFVYNSVTAPTKISASHTYGGLQEQGPDRAFISSVGDVAERLYYIFLCAYVNGVKAQVRRARAAYGEDGGEGGENWYWGMAADEGEKAVVLAREGWKTGSKEKAMKALEVLTKSVEFVNKANRKSRESEYGNVQCV